MVPAWTQSGPFAAACHQRDIVPRSERFGIAFVKRQTIDRGAKCCEIDGFWKGLMRDLGSVAETQNNYERNLETSEALIQISMIHLLLKRLASAKA